MTQPTSSLWHLITALVQQTPLSPPWVEQVLGMPLETRSSASNDQFEFYRGHNLQLQDGVVLAQIDLSIKKSDPHVSSLALAVQGPCITLAELRQRCVSSLTLAGTPRGGSLEEATSYATNVGSWRVVFGFKEKNPDCLATVALHPKPKS